MTETRGERGEARTLETLLAEMEGAKSAGNYTLAESLCEKALSLAQEDEEGGRERMPAILFSLGQLKAVRGLDREAIGVFEQALLGCSQQECSVEQRVSILIELSRSQRDIAAYNQAHEAIETARRLIADSGLLDTPMWGRVLITRGSIFFKEDLLERAREDFLESLKLFEGKDYPKDLAMIHEFLGFIHRKEGDPDRAIEYFEKSWAARKLANDERGMMISCGQLGSLYRIKGDLEFAVYYCNKALDLARARGEKRALAGFSNNLATAYFRRGAWDQAENYWKQALSLMEEIGNPGGRNVMHSNLFRLALERGQWERAQVHLEVCQASMFSLQDRVRALSAAGRLWFCKGALEKAREAHEEELKIAVSSMLKEDAADAYSDLAKVLLAEGKPKEAWRKALEAMRLYGRMKSKLNQGVVFRLLAEIYAQLGRPLRAERTIRTSIDILRKVGASVEVAKSYLCGSRLPGEGVNLEEQAAWLKEACAIFKKVALGPMMVQGYLALTRLEMRRRSLDSAVENLHCASEALGGLDDPEALRRILRR